MPFVDYNPGLSNSEKSKVSWDEDKKHLVWFVLFLYPQYEITDFVPGFCETTHFCDLFSKMFETYPEWDTEKQYTVDNINVYYKGRKNYKLFPLDCNKTLLEVMKEPYFELRSWVPEFIVLIKNSSSEKAFLKMHGL